MGKSRSLLAGLDMQDKSCSHSIDYSRKEKKSLAQQ